MVSAVSDLPRVATMSDELERVARAEQVWREARAAYDAASAARREAICDAYRAGDSLHAIAEAIGTTHRGSAPHRAGRGTLTTHADRGRASEARRDEATARPSTEITCGSGAPWGRPGP
jgi:hypothetical protein